MKNKVLVNLWRPFGCTMDEVDVSWRPVNFDIYSNLFPEMIEEAAQEWLSENEIQYDALVEIIFVHESEMDRGGALLNEYFTPIHIEKGQVC